MIESPQPPPRLVRTLALVGLMGAGKTSVGKRLALLLGVPFVDSDNEIAEAAGMSIPEIFSSLGEPAFRDGERRVIARLLADRPKVLATGGGAFVEPRTRAELLGRADLRLATCRRRPSLGSCTRPSRSAIAAGARSSCGARRPSPTPVADLRRSRYRRRQSPWCQSRGNGAGDRRGSACARRGVPRASRNSGAE